MAGIILTKNRKYHKTVLKGRIEGFNKYKQERRKTKNGQDKMPYKYDNSLYNLSFYKGEI